MVDLSFTLASLACLMHDQITLSAFFTLVSFAFRLCGAADSARAIGGRGATALLPIRLPTSCHASPRLIVLVPFVNPHDVTPRVVVRFPSITPHDYSPWVTRWRQLKFL